MKDIAAWAAIALAGASAVFGLYAAFGVKVNDNQDTFIADLRRQSLWASLAAAAARLSVFARSGRNRDHCTLRTRICEGAC
jgi:hypothetical protein